MAPDRAFWTDIQVPVQAEPTCEVARVKPALFASNPKIIKEMPRLLHNPDKPVLFGRQSTRIIAKLPEILDAHMKALRHAY